MAFSSMSDPTTSLLWSSASIKMVPLPQNGSKTMFEGLSRLCSARFIMICESFGGSMPIRASRNGFL